MPDLAPSTKSAFPQKRFLKQKVMFDDTTPNVIRMMCLTDVICELVSLAPSRSATPLDELLYDQVDK